ncbi:MAG: hypothetical protein PCFJNLEI_03524 [Verrucomicrobiae bacterium]|nr:hypothetical protein [Verrucomicrobiae bacterium]
MPHSNRQNAQASLAVALMVALFAAILAAFYVPAYEGVDQNAYLCSARRLVLTGSTAKHTAHPLEYVSDNMVQTGEGVYYPKYPLGYPWLCAVAYRLAGPEAVFLVGPALVLLAGVGIFLLATAMIGREDRRAACAMGQDRRACHTVSPVNGQAESDETRFFANARSTLGNPFAGVLAAILLVTNPWLLLFGIASSSHPGSVAFAVWGMYFLWRWTQRGGWGTALAAGALTAGAYTMRYSEALLVFPVVAMMVWRYCAVRNDMPPGRRQLHQWFRDVSLMVVGAAVVVTPLLVHHCVAFGGPFRTGYGLCGESTGFGWQWFRVNWWLMLTKLTGPGLFFVFPLSVAGLGYLVTHDRPRAMLLGLWIVPPWLLYTAYYWAPDWDWTVPVYLRFFMSLFPALIICALILLLEVVKPKPAWSVGVGVFVAMTATFNLRTAVGELGKWSEKLQGIQTMGERVRRHVPDGAILVSSADVLNSLEFVGNYELYSVQTFDRNLLTWRTGTLTKPGPHPFQARKAQYLVDTLGHLSNRQLAALQQSLLASNLAAGREIAVVTTPEGLRQLRGRMGEAFRYHSLTEWYQVAFGKNGEMRPTAVALYRLEPRGSHRPAPESRAALEEQVDWLQFRVQMLREEYDDKYPGARQKWEVVISGEQQLRELCVKTQQLNARQPESR